jgi:hypothetical protein
MHKGSSVEAREIRLRQIRDAVREVQSTKAKEEKPGSTGDVTYRDKLESRFGPVHTSVRARGAGRYKIEHPLGQKPGPRQAFSVTVWGILHQAIDYCYDRTQQLVVFGTLPKGTPGRIIRLDQGEPKAVDEDSSPAANAIEHDEPGEADAATSTEAAVGGPLQVFPLVAESDAPELLIPYPQLGSFDQNNEVAALEATTEEVEKPRGTLTEQIANILGCAGYEVTPSMVRAVLAARHFVQELNEGVSDGLV